MARPIIEKINLWRNADVGLKTRFNKRRMPPAFKRDDIESKKTRLSIERGGKLQKLRLKHYPSIDIDYESMYAGTFDGTIGDVEDRLLELGFRNNPTAYVEVSDKHGPDDGSYAKNIITEVGGKLDIPSISNRPGILRRAKRQIHVTLFQQNEEVDILAHEEMSAWLQPVRHVAANDSNHRIGVRDFRDIWYDEFGEELDGGSDIVWESTH